MNQLFKKSIFVLIIVITSLFTSDMIVKASIHTTVTDFTIDPVWSKLYGGRSSDQLRSLAPTTDGGFVGAGYTYDGASMGGNSYGDYDALLVKYNKYGDPEFSTQYGGNLADTFYSINQTSEGGYITCGYTQSNKSGTITTNLLGDDDGLLVKFSPTGAVEWEKRFGTTGAKWQNYTSCRNITENKDGTFTMVGYHFGNNNGDITDPNNGMRDGYISKVAANGDIMWTQVFGGSQNDSFNAAYELPDGSFMVVGRSQSSNSGEITATNKGNYDALIAKFDKDGNPLWHRLYGGSKSESFESLSVNSAGEVIVVGNTNSPDGDFLTGGNGAYGGVDGFVGKLDANGRVMWHKTIGGTGDDYIYSVIDTNEDKYLLSGTSKSSNSGIITDVNNGNTDGLVIAMNEDGTLDWNHLFGGSGDDTFEDSVAVDNGSGYVVGGYSSSANSGTIMDSNSGEDDTLLVKFSTNNIPTLEVPEFVELNVGDTYDPLLDVTAVDYEDGDMTSGIKVTNRVDTAIPGVYITDYEVMDLERNTSTGQQIVLVNDGTYDYNDEYILHANNVTHMFEQVRTDDISILDDADFKVYDKITGLEIVDPEVTVDKGDYQAANGEYPIIFTFNGFSITSTFTVDNGGIPQINVNDFYTSNLGDNFDTASKVTVVDDEDGPITTITIDDSKLDINTLGVYPIDISVTDSDGNIVTKTIIVAVVDDTATVTDDYVFYNVDYSHRLGQYTLDKDYHLENSNLKVYEKATAALVDNDDIMIRFNDYEQKVGLYDVDFMVKDKPEQFVTSAVNVVTGSSPVISGPDYLEVTQGQPYVDPYGGISISDKEDDVIPNSKLTSDITIDTNKPGVYIITYNIVDSDFNEDSFTQTVVVKNDKMVIDDQYIIYAVDYELRVGQVSHVAADIANLSKLQVYDKATDTLLDPNVVTIDSSALKAEPGTYPVIISMGELERTISVTVTSGQAPEITGTDYFEVNQGETTNFTASLDVSDEEDTDLSTADVITNGTVDVMTPGVYELEYKVTDSDGNEDIFKQQIVVKASNTSIDDRYVIFGDDYEIYVRQVTQTTAQIIERSNLKVYDKHNRTYIENPELIIDDSAIKPKAGTYPLTATYNGLSHRLNVTVISGEEPTISGDDFFTSNLGDNFDTASKMTVLDNEDGPITTYTIDDSNLDINTLGVYPIDISVTDSDGNTVSKTIIVAVVDDTATVTDDYVFYNVDYSHRLGQYTLDKDYHLENSNLKVYEKATAARVDNADIMIRFNDYEQKVGLYDVDFMVKDKPEQFVTSAVNVVTGSSPVITGPDYLEVTQGQPYVDPYGGISITDKEDDVIPNSQLTSDITIDTNKPGVYIITYNIVDTDFNEDSFTQTVVVKNDKMVIDDQYIIYAVDYSLRVGQVSHVAADIANLSKLQVYDKATDTLLDPNVVTIDSSALKAEPGTYPVIISMGGLERTISVTVTSGQTPEITGTDYFEVNQGETTNFTASLDVSDEEDTDLSTADVITNGTVDVMTPGVYELEYKVTDSDGNEDIFKQQIVVKASNTSIDDRYVIFGDDYEIYVRQVTQTTAQIIERSNLKVYDKHNRTYIENPELIIDDSAIKPKAGTYPLTATYNGLSHRLNVTVISGDAPTITGADFFTSNLGDNFDTASKLTVLDNEDGPITTYSIDDSRLDINTLGVYPIDISVTDSDGNTVSKTIIVAVVDDTATVTDDYVFYNVDYSHRLGQYTLDKDYHLTKSTLKVYEKATAARVDNADIMIRFNDYEQKVGLYDVDFMVKDKPEQFVTSAVNVVTGSSPVISGPDYLEVTQGQPYVDPYGGISITDKEDDVIPNSQLTSDITIDTNKPGVYIITYNIVDTDFNEDSFTQTVVVKNDKMVIDDQYIIYAVDYELRVGQVSHVAADIANLSKLQVYDKATDTLLDPSAVTIDSSALKAEPGTYPVIISMGGLERTISVTVTSGEAPEITGTDYIEVNQGSLTDFTTSLNVTDEEDTDLSKADLTTNGTVDVMTPGVYELEYNVIDSDGNEDNFKQQIVVKASNTSIGDRYVIFGDDYEIYVRQIVQTADQIIERSNLKVYDKQNRTYIDNPELLIVDSAIKAQAGVYPLIVTYNGLSHRINVTVINGEKPTISGADYAEIEQGSTFDPLAGVTLADNEDTGLTPDMITVTGTVDTSKPGVYNLVYSYTDSDKNTTTVNRMVVVKDENMVINDNYIIYAHDYTTKLSDLDLSNKVVSELSGLKVYNKLANEYVTNPNVVIDTSKVKPLGGTYEVKITYLGLERIINVTVDAGEKPIITGEEFSVIAQGSTFNPIVGMEVTDKEDGKINPNALKVTGTVDTSKPGVYNLVYTYVDLDSNKTTFNREVVVNNKDTQITDDYVIYAHDYSTLLSNASTASSFILNKSEAYVYDRLTKTYLSLNQIDIDRGLLENKVGVYEVNIGKGDTTKSITVTVSAGTKPQIYVVNPVVEVNLGDKVNFAELITYNDLETPHSKLDFDYETNYDPKQVGVYEVNYTVTDLDGNVQTAKVTIFVNDGTYVTNNNGALTGSDVTYNLSNDLSLEQYILQNANIHAYDFKTGTEMDLSNLKIDLRNVRNVPGTYDVYLSINGILKTIKVTITEDDEGINSEVKSEEKSEVKDDNKLQITGNRLYLINIILLSFVVLCLVSIKKKLN